MSLACLHLFILVLMKSHVTLENIPWPNRPPVLPVQLVIRVRPQPVLQSCVLQVHTQMLDRHHVQRVVLDSLVQPQVLSPPVHKVHTHLS